MKNNFTCYKSSKHQSGAAIVNLLQLINFFNYFRVVAYRNRVQQTTVGAFSLKTFDLQKTF